jgi:hypothetical protein
MNKEQLDLVIKQANEYVEENYIFCDNFHRLSEETLIKFTLLKCIELLEKQLNNQQSVTTTVGPLFDAGMTAGLVHAYSHSIELIKTHFGVNNE